MDLMIFLPNSSDFKLRCAPLMHTLIEHASLIGEGPAARPHFHLINLQFAVLFIAAGSTAGKARLAVNYAIVGYPKYYTPVWREQRVRFSVPMELS